MRADPIRSDLIDYRRSPEEEGALVQRAVHGDRAAFEWVMRRHNRQLYRLARASLNDETEAKDALQDAYLCAYREISKFRAESTVATWLTRIVLNECAARRRRSKRRHDAFPLVSLESHMNEIAPPDSDHEQPEHALARTQMRAILERKVTALPEGLRLVFVLRSIEELGVEETSKSLGISEDTVRVRHFRAKRLLREALAHDIESAKHELYQFGGADCDAIVANVLARLGSAQLPQEQPSTD